MQVETKNGIQKMTPEEYEAYSKAKSWRVIADSISWIAFCFMCVCCHYCSHH